MPASLNPSAHHSYHGALKNTDTLRDPIVIGDPNM